MQSVEVLRFRVWRKLFRGLWLLCWGVSQIERDEKQSKGTQGEGLMVPDETNVVGWARLSRVILFRPQVLMWLCKL